MVGNGANAQVLGLRAGDVVRVRSEREILGTLDESGKLDGLPFMPEMVRHCGTTVRVFRRADKTCDTVNNYTTLRLSHVVHLDGLRCDGGHHGGCEAGCLFFWKEAWLQRVDEHTGSDRLAVQPAPRLTLSDLVTLTTRPDSSSEPDRVFVCQATELPRAGTGIAWWDPRQYIKDLRSGNVSPGTFVRGMAIAWYNALQRWRGGKEYPHVAGTLVTTPTHKLDLQAGERVRVRSREAILATLSTTHKNRGLWFDVEMVPYCGGEYRVLRRVTQIIEERTGKLMRLPGDCIILDGVVCQGCLSRNRLFCPRSIYPYWREIWLERVPG